ncbi:hypothetical protein A9995_02665 [Erythrobacter sp. QSSC1-22B]|uniref:hypothetical protein n=1 Tax=Erythrobacter sp. QSSC1-22B TaxID=1860125 RepID=UPI000805ED97|nr:hypothetical protein [Erythrobacter sp. QSSC1-22B]OBX20620.1 hypothetical protein A9995_02665 [Erythrobacter sp. QSSC1-22B]
MPELTITDMRLLLDVGTSNTQVLAYFDCEDGSYVFEGCTLLRFASTHTVRANLPTVHHYTDRQCAIRFADRGIRDDLTELAKKSFMDLGGDPDLVLHPYRGCDVNGWPTHPLHPANLAAAREEYSDIPPKFRPRGTPSDPVKVTRKKRMIDGHELPLPPPIRNPKGE